MTKRRDKTDLVGDALNSFTSRSSQPDEIMYDDALADPSIFDNIDELTSTGIALANVDDKRTQVGPFIITPAGLVIDGDVTQEQYEAFGTVIRKIRKRMTWMIGDWLVYGQDRKWGQTYSYFAELTGIKDRTLEDWAYTCRNVKISERSEKLGINHHRLVAKFEPSVQSEILTYAEQFKLSVRQLGAYIEALEAGYNTNQIEAIIHQAGQPIPPQTLGEKLNHVSKSVKKLLDAETVDTWTKANRTRAQQAIDELRELLDAAESKLKNSTDH